MGKTIAEQTQQLRDRLTKAIMAKVNAPLSEAEDGLSGLGAIEREPTQRL